MTCSVVVASALAAALLAGAPAAWAARLIFDCPGATAPPPPAPAATPPPSEDPGPPPPLAIREAQQLLQALGYAPGAPDGKWGPRTADAHAAFVRDAGLPQAASLTPQTLQALRAAAEAQGVQAGAAEPSGATPEMQALSLGLTWAEFEALPPVGSVFRDCDQCPEMVVVPAGSFLMGSPASEEWRHDDEGPVHRVEIAHPFAVGVYEVTFAEWDACVSGGGCGGYRPDDCGWGRGSRPVVNVSWEDAQGYVRWLSQKTGGAYRLLSESEWEYAARAGSRTRYHWGDDIGRNRANCGRCGSRWDLKQTAPVGSFGANGFGLHDVHGNVWEWVEDCWNERYAGAPSDGSAWQSGEDCGLRLVRGGSWLAWPNVLRSARRSRGGIGLRRSYVGFRVARTLAP